MTNSPNIFRLWYRQPANKFVESLPLGNGNQGAMIFGGIDQEILWLNENTFWSGEPSKNSINPDAIHHLAEIRQLYFQEKYAEAEKLTQKYLTGKQGNYGTNLPVGKLLITIQHPTSNYQNYKRELILNESIHRVEYNCDDIIYSRESFISNPDGVMVSHFSASQPQKLNLKISFAPITAGETKQNLIESIIKLWRNLKVGKTDANAYTFTAKGSDTFLINLDARENLHSDGKCGVHAVVGVKIIKDGGEIRLVNQEMIIENASSVTVLISIHTNFSGKDPLFECEQTLSRVTSKEYTILKGTHIADFSARFNRMDISFSNTEDVKANLPTDERFRTFKSDNDDPGLFALLFQYGRYLLLCSSRENSILPANLQGSFNDNLACRMGWTNDYHLDINTQMNYYHAESCNLSECTVPLHQFLLNLSRSGEKIAEDLYGSPGWVTHCVTNAWGYSAPGWSIGWGLHPTGGAWLARQLWEHFEFTNDLEFLKNKAYPILKKSADFFISYMVPHPQFGWFVTGPSISPEVGYIDQNGHHRCADMGVTCDRVLVMDILRYTLAAAKELKIDSEYQQTLLKTIEKLPPLQIGKQGQLQEWLKDYKMSHPYHRHASHLISLYPSDQISPHYTPELAHAAQKTLELRQQQDNWEGTGWSFSNMLGFYARLGLSVPYYANLCHMVEQCGQPNLFLPHAAIKTMAMVEAIYELDGNTGYSAAIAEMLMQSVSGELWFLPALPEQLSSGYIRGLCARGGFVVDIAWEKHELKEIAIKSQFGKPLRLRYKEIVKTYPTKLDQVLRFNGKLELLP